MADTASPRASGKEQRDPLPTLVCAKLLITFSSKSRKLQPKAGYIFCRTSEK